MTSQVRILILEDVETDAELLEDQLRKSKIDFRATWVDRGVSFSRALEVFQPDIVLSDLHLPRFSGMEALRIVRERAPSTPVIIVTGAVDDETAVNCLKAGAADYVLKDRLNRLGPAVSAALEKGRARDERARAEEALQESEQRFRAVAQSAADAIVCADADGNVVFWNDAAEKIFGYAEDEIVGKPLTTLSSEQFGQVHSRGFEKAGVAHVARLAGKPIELPGLRKDGSGFPIELSLASWTAGENVYFSAIIRDITERKRAEKTLRLMRVAIDSSADAVFVLGRDARFVQVNETACRSLGYSRDELLSLKVHHIVPNASQEDWPIRWEVLKARSSTLHESLHRRKDGTLFPVEISSNFYEFEGVEYDVACVRDITERKQAENALRESQEKYRTLVDNLPAITYMSAVNGGSIQTYVSPQVEELLGLSPDEFIADPDLFAHCLHADDRERVLAAWANAYESGASLDIQYRMIHRDGTVRWFWEKATVTRECNAKPCRLQGIMLDVTESKEIERERDLLNAAIEQSTDSVIITDVDGTIEYVNPAFERITGYSRGETIGRNQRFLQGGEHDSDSYREMWTALTRGESWSALFTNRRKDGTTYELQSTIFPIRDASGAPINYVQIGQDVSDQLETERQLRQAQKMEAVGQLTGGIAHDFNNILTSVLANAELIAADVPHSHREVHQSAGEINEAAQRGASLVRKLMTFSRPEHLRKEPLDLARLCREAGATLRRVLPENIDFQIVARDGAGHIDGDPGALEQIIFNLATNARDAMPDGGSLTMTVERVAVDEPLSVDCGFDRCDCDALGDYLCLSVSDTGIGMDDETKTKIFEPFFTTKPVGQGTGLGMAMVFGLVKEHGGCVTVDSEVGQGTTIKIYFPVGKEAAPQQVSPEPHLQARCGSETILLVEDEKAVRRPAKQVLERYGYKVLIAVNGEQALEILRAPDPVIDLVLTDVIMPKMGGWELYKKAVTNGIGPRFLFTSGYAAGQMGNGDQVDPTMPFLSKPWTTEQLLTEVRKVLEREVKR